MQDNPSTHNLNSRARASAISRQQNAETARIEGEDNTLWTYANSMFSSVNIRYSKSSASIEAFEWDMHDLWHAYYHAAMNISNGSPNQDRLAFQVIQAREQGVLLKRALSNDVEEEAITTEAITSDGRIWTDLPFLVQDMTNYWVSYCATMTTEQRLNFAAFLAKLTSVGLTDDRLSGIALIVLRDTLETARPTGQLGDQKDEDPNRQLRHLSVASLLPAANAWLFTSGLKLIQLSEKCWNNCPPSIGQPGHLLQDHPTVQVPNAGFSPQRWMFWLRRLDEIAHDARQAGHERLANYTERMMDNMLTTVGDTDTAVKRALDDAGGMVQYKPTVHLFGTGRQV